jgi:protein-disulfide isomerase
MISRSFLSLALAVLLSSVAPGAPVHAADAMKSADREAIEKVIHDYLLEHPEVVIDALKAGQEKLKAKEAEEAKAEIAKRRDELLRDPASPVGGNPKGDVTIVEFFDYRCPYCKQMEPGLEALLKEDPKLRIVYKEFPILGPESLVASRAALAALKQGNEKYLRFHATMMNAKGQINEDVILKLAGDSGLDVARIKTDMSAPEIETLIKRNYELADSLDIKGTPAFVIGDSLTPGAVDIATLRRLVAAARRS